MQRERCRTSQVLRITLMAAILTLAGCVTAPVEAPPEEPPAPAVVIESSVPIVPAPPPPPPAEEPPPVIVEPLPSVAIVLASRVPAYESVVNELGSLLERYSIYDLSDKSQPPAAAFRLINDSDTAAVIAIGLNAARSALEYSAVPVIFGQVFNYQDHDLITGSSRGVAAIAPIEAQIDVWREVDPTVSRIGVIVGDGHEDLIAEAQMAAERHAMTLDVQITRSDQETLYFFRRMAPDIDGYWLMPDNRVLSARVIREMLDESRRRGISVVVPADSMLSLGAAISITTVPSDIAARLADIVRQVQAGRLADVPAMTPLTELQISTNESALQGRAGHTETVAAEDSLQ